MKSWMKTLISSTILSMGMLLTSAVAQDNIVRDYGDDDQQNDRSNEQYDNNNQPLVDRYLDVQVWTNHRDGEFYEGDNITISFMANRDAFVVIYSIDTRGRVEILYPADPGDDNFVTGGVTYRLPSVNSNYDLKVTGPSGTENIQVIASRERIPIPDWYPNSGITTDEEDRSDFMEYINARYFVRYDGQRFAYDRASLYVNEWEPVYYQPVYYPDYPSWSVCGNVYIDYPYGSTVYINGIYWGCAPLYVPRILCGWQTVTIYDPWGHCWEDDIHVSRYRTVVLNKTIVHTSAQNVSKYKEVRFSGYKDPVKNGYPKFAEKQKIAMGSSDVSKTGVGKNRILPSKNDVNNGSDNVVLPKKYLYGDGSVTKTDRGYETKGGSAAGSGYEKKRADGNNGSTSTYRKDKAGSNNGPSSYRKDNTGNSGSTYTPSQRKTQSGNSGSGQPTYRKGSGSSSAPTKKGPAVAPSKPKSSDNDGKVEAKPGAVQKEVPQGKSEGKVSQPAPKSGGDSGPKKGHVSSGRKKGN